MKTPAAIPATQAAALLLALSVALPATAAGAIPAGARLAATCTGCHGTNGATQGNALPPLAGQPKDQLLTALKDFKTAKRPATIMTQLTKGYTDEQLEALAAYFAAQSKGDAK
ncbi:c-type cytochrome [Pseudoduganella sp. OTU4001]|uniref:c-type cytochrome n=1 Tax=Pseudoduganella sp. OTU4001 TaxID=3043854 RepID=UPI00313D2D0A